MGILLGAMLLSAMTSGSDSLSMDSISASGFRTWDDVVGDKLKNRVKSALSSVSYNEQRFVDAANKLGEIPDDIKVYESQMYEIQKKYKV